MGANCHACRRRYAATAGNEGDSIPLGVVVAGPAARRSPLPTDFAQRLTDAWRHQEEVEDGEATPFLLFPEVARCGAPWERRPCLLWAPWERGPCLLWAPWERSPCLVRSPLGDEPLRLAPVLPWAVPLDCPAASVQLPMFCLLEAMSSTGGLEWGGAL